jgi:hypothetical protein
MRLLCRPDRSPARHPIGSRAVHHYLDVLGLVQQVQGTAAPVA